MAACLLLLRSRYTKNLSSWLDRKFFREAYNSEQLLAELSHRVRRYNESGPMLEMVLEEPGRDTAHRQDCRPAARWKSISTSARDRDPDARYCRKQDAVQLPMNSTTVRNLMRINTPVHLYRENPDGWLLLASSSERDMLDSMSANCYCRFRDGIS